MWKLILTSMSTVHLVIINLPSQFQAHQDLNLGAHYFEEGIIELASMQLLAANCYFDSIIWQWTI